MAKKKNKKTQKPSKKNKNESKTEAFDYNQKIDEIKQY